MMEPFTLQEGQVVLQPSKPLSRPVREQKQVLPNLSSLTFYQQGHEFTNTLDYS